MAICLPYLDSGYPTPVSIGSSRQQGRVGLELLGWNGMQQPPCDAHRTAARMRDVGDGTKAREGIPGLLPDKEQKATAIARLLTIAAAGREAHTGSMT